MTENRILDHDALRAAILAIAGGSRHADDVEQLTLLVSLEIHQVVRVPSKVKPGGHVAQWMIKHGYSEEELRRWLYEAGSLTGIGGITLPHLIWTWAHVLVSVLIGKQPCACFKQAFSEISEREARRRCESFHNLTRENLEAWQQTAPERVAAQLKRSGQTPSSEKHQEILHWHSDPLNFVRKGVHGNVSTQVGRDFGYSMLAAVLQTPRESRICVVPYMKPAKTAGKPPKRVYVLSDTRNGVHGEWTWSVLFCRNRSRLVTDLSEADWCGHCWELISAKMAQRPSNPFREVELAECANKHRWLWVEAAHARQCPEPNCGRSRKKRVVARVIEDIELPNNGNFDWDAPQHRTPPENTQTRFNKPGFT